MNIGKEAFSGCTVLTSVTIPDSVRHIGYSAFYETAWYDNQPDGLVYAGKVAYKMKGTCPSEVVIKDGTVSITASAFSDCTVLTSVTIPDSVAGIGYRAFYKCTGLTSVTIPDSVMSIGDYAFYGCTGLTNVTILGSVSEIYGSVFSDCTGLTTVNIPDSVRRIDDYAFYNCRGLTSVTIPDSVTGIDDYAFYGCTGLTSVTIPDSVTRIYYHAFGYYYDDDRNESKLDGFTIYGYKGIEAERYASENGFTFIKLTEKKDEASGIITTVPDDVELRVINVLDQMPVGTIKAYDITLAKDSDTVQPNNVVTVKIPCANENAKVYRLEADGKMTDMNAEYKGGYYVFYTDHFSVYVLAEPHETSGTTGDCTWEIKDGVLTISGNGKMGDYDSVWQNDAYVTTAPWGGYDFDAVIIENGVTNVGNYAFYGCSGLTSVTIPDSVASIGKYAFYGCTGLTSVTIGSSVTSIGYEAFSGCTGLTSVTIPDSVTNIGEYAFYGCTNLKSVTIPDSVTSIGDIAFGYYYDDDWNELKVDGFTIYGKEGSEAERYATEKGFIFVNLGASGVTVPGDVTGDGKTNVQDCTAILRYVRRIDALSDDQLKCGDVTGDNKVNVQDVTRILRHVRQIEALY